MLEHAHLQKACPQMSEARLRVQLDADLEMQAAAGSDRMGPRERTLALNAATSGRQEAGQRSIRTK